MSTPRRWLWGVAALLLAAGAAIGCRQILWQVYGHSAVEYAATAYGLSSFEAAIYFWTGGLGLLVTIGLTLGGALLLPAGFRVPNRSLALIPLAAAAALAARIFVFHGTAVGNEENVYRFTAHLLSHGHLTLPVDASAATGQRWGWLNHSATWSGIYPYGWPVLLAFGYLVHGPQIVNPLLAAVALWQAAAIARRAYGERAGALTLLFLATAPFFALTAATDMSGPTVAASVLAAMFGIWRYSEDGKTSWLISCGVASGAALLCKPQTAAALLGPWWIWLLLKERRPGKAILWIAAVLASVAAILALNTVRTGSPWDTPWDTPYDAALRAWAVDLSSATLGFGANYLAVGGVGVHTLGLGILFDFLNLLRVNYWMLGVPLSLLLVWFVPVSENTTAARATKLLLSSVGVMLAVSTTSYNPGLTITGPSEYFEVACLLMILAAAGADRLGAWFRQTPAAQFAPHGWTALIGAILAANLGLFIPIHVRSLAAMSRSNAAIEKTIGAGPAVIFVPNARLPEAAFDPTIGYVSDLPMIASPNSAVIFLAGRDPQQDRATWQKDFPNRRAYRYSPGADGLPTLESLP
jgi:4-amino-4-deoxy-L-arabinose transferase-like glycosyltransferase